ncbi:MAG: hypothetical protein SV422_06085 [Pseudomonadota bacterium]|nr:hypothetical protein [Pseudomonadota bacterium]
MKGFGMLLLYFFTWRSVIVGAVVLGLAMLALASSLAMLFPQGAAAATLLAFVFLLAVPYLAAPKALRTLISNRRLTIVPGFPLRTGVAMLLLTFMTAAFLPLGAVLLRTPADFYWIGLHVFIIASLYTVVSQLVVTSRHMWLHVNWLPIAAIVLLSLFGEQLWSLATNHTAVLLIAAIALAGWLRFLVLLARKPDFKPAYATDLQAGDSDMNALFAKWVNRRPEQRPAPATSLLLGYPANLRSRAMNVAFVIVLNPLLSVLLVHFMARDNAGAMVLGGTDLFLVMSLATGFITGAVAWAETGARARLLWLRVPGARSEVWHRLERELWDYFMLLLVVVAVVAGVIILMGDASMLLLHYVLTLFTLTIYQRYLPLAARLNGWSSLMQTLVQIASLAAIGATLVYSLRIANFNLAFLLELCLLAFGVLFRTLAQFGFRRVDWQVLRPRPSKRMEAAA